MSPESQLRRTKFTVSANLWQLRSLAQQDAVSDVQANRCARQTRRPWHPLDGAAESLGYSYLGFETGLPGEVHSSRVRLPGISERSGHRLLPERHSTTHRGLRADAGDEKSQKACSLPGQENRHRRSRSSHRHALPGQRGTGRRGAPTPSGDMAQLGVNHTTTLAKS